MSDRGLQRGWHRGEGRLPRPLLALAALLLAGCASSPERLAALNATRTAVAALGQRDRLPVIAVVGGVRRAGVRHEDIAAGYRDELAERLAREIERALARQDVRVISHRDMPLAMDVLRLQDSDMFPPDVAGDEAALGRFHQADVLVSAEYVPDDDGDYILDLVVIDVHTLEVLALGRGYSRPVLRRGWDAAVETAAVLTVPLPVLWDMLRYATSRSFDEEPDDGWDILTSVLMFPLHLVSAPFLAEWDSTRFWLDLDEQSSGDEPEVPGATRQHS